MKVTYPIVSAKVSEQVTGILVIENTDEKNLFTLPLFANGSPTLIFQTVKGKVTNDIGYLTLFGQTVRPEILTLKGAFNLIAYFLSPRAITRLFGIEPSQLTDYPVDLGLIMNCRALQERLLNTESISERIVLLDELIADLNTERTSDTKKIDFATQLIQQRPDVNILHHIQEQLQISERTFQRWFENNIGVTPNQFRRIIQFNRAFQQLNSRSYHHLSDIAFDNGYTDQSHFIRSFKEFTAMRPNDYLKLLSSVK